MKKKQHGFSLVELAIVLVIIGLIAGAITAADGLIDSANIRTVVVEIENYQSAIAGFKDSYNSLPGDMPDATNYWATGGGVAIFNGGGDEQITHADGGGDADEVFPAWAHLVRAGLIDGNFSGDGGFLTTGTNAPESKFRGGAYFLKYYDATLRNMLVFGLQGAPDGGISAESMNIIPILQPKEAYEIDSKLDDGNPNEGRLRASDDNLTAGTCVTEGDSGTADDIYNYAPETRECYLRIRLITER